MNIKQLNEALSKLLENYSNDLQDFIDDIFYDTSGWEFPFVDLQSLRMYDTENVLYNISDEELLNYLKNNDFAIFTISPKYKKDIESLGYNFNNYNGMSFVSSTLNNDELKINVLKGIEDGEW